MRGFQRDDGRIGIRNNVLVVYLVECAHHVARQIVMPYGEQGAQVIGFPGCFPNAYADRMLKSLCTHPNVGGVLLVSLGCEGTDRAGIAAHVKASGRPVEVLVIQQSGGTKSTIDAGRQWVSSTLEQLKTTPKCNLKWSDLIIATICGGSDATSGITANPAIGRAFDQLIERDAACIFEETGELIGCEQIMADRSATPELAEQIVASVNKAARYYQTMGHGSFAPGNAEGGLTTIEEKSLGAYAKSGQSKIVGLIKPGDRPTTGGLYLLDVVPDGEPRFGFPNISDNAEIGELMACGAHLTLFSTGRGSVVGSAIAPVIKVCANPQTYERMTDDMDVNAGRIITDESTIDEVADEIVNSIEQTVDGKPTCSEALGHQEFIMTYKTFEPLGPGCLPVV